MLLAENINGLIVAAISDVSQMERLGMRTSKLRSGLFLYLSFFVFFRDFPKTKAVRAVHYIRELEHNIKNGSSKEHGRYYNTKMCVRMS